MRLPISASGMSHCSVMLRGELAQHVVQYAAVLVVVAFFWRVDTDLSFKAYGVAVFRRCRYRNRFGVGVGLTADAKGLLAGESK